MFGCLRKPILVGCVFGVLAGVRCREGPQRLLKESIEGGARCFLSLAASEGRKRKASEAIEEKKGVQKRQPVFRRICWAG